MFQRAETRGQVENRIHPCDFTGKWSSRANAHHRTTRKVAFVIRPSTHLDVYMHGGLGMARTAALQKSVNLLVLKILSRRPRLHGYPIMSAIQDISAEVLRVEEGSLYPALHRMEESGWIRADPGQWPPHPDHSAGHNSCVPGTSPPRHPNRSRIDAAGGVRRPNPSRKVHPGW